MLRLQSTQERASAKHDAVSIVIPGAKNKDHVGLNTSASELNEISSLMNEINSVYTKYFFDDVHHRW